MTEPKFKVNNSNSCCKVFLVKVLEGVESLGDEITSSDNSSGSFLNVSIGSVEESAIMFSSTTSSSLVPRN